MLDDVDSMIIECELYRRRARRSGGATAQRRPSSQAVAAKVTLRTLIGTTTTRAGYEPAKELAVLTVTGLASTTDPDDLLPRGSKIFEPLRLMRTVGIDMVGTTSGNQVPIRLMSASHT